MYVCGDVLVFLQNVECAQYKIVVRMTDCTTKGNRQRKMMILMGLMRDHVRI